MSLLFKNLRIHQVFGANTDVGKTLLTTALVRASAAAGHDVFYLKPVSTGPMQDADDHYIREYTRGHEPRVHAACLYRFNEPVSPQLAAQLATKENQKVDIPSDQQFASAVTSHIKQCAARLNRPSHMYVETAGGVHSPTLSGTTQVDSYRPLFLPTILIGDSRLGGISATISAHESLALRGYIVDAILLFKDDYYRNWEYLEPYFAERNVNVFALHSPPPKHADLSTNRKLTEEYYRSIVPTGGNGGIFNALSHLDACHSKRMAELESMPQRTLDSIWWPFVQHGHVKSKSDVTVIDSASSDFFSTYVAPSPASGDKKTVASPSVLVPQFDGSASWWTQALGHAHPSLTLAAANAAGRYGHVMFPVATHLPALTLAEQLIQSGPGKGWANKVFFSDDGSTGMEVAIKMALRAFALRSAGSSSGPRVKRKDLGVLGLKGSYHGDTIGAMDACEEGVYTCEWHEAKGYWLDPPTVSIRDGTPYISLPPAIAHEMDGGQGEVKADSLGWTYTIEERLRTPLADVYRRFIARTLKNLRDSERKLAALVLEPIVMGAGGMIFVDPLFQRVLIDVVRDPATFPQTSSTATGDWSGLPVIFDEVFVGLYRLGLQSIIPLLGVTPDISVNAKILTGGLVPMAVTLATNPIFQAFQSEEKVDALLHGHSYTAYPVGCAVANETMKIVEKLAKSESWQDARRKWREGVDGAHGNALKSGGIWSFWDPEFVERVSRMGVVDEVMTLGTVLSIKISSRVGRGDGYQSNSAQKVFDTIKATPELSASNANEQHFGVHYRTLGNVAYFMLSLNTERRIVEELEAKIERALRASALQ
ncbi:PLP-dependent transferase [Panus rudis PR-1116 ss-1]|nr:PLP-dependent transferase [Panus rudis PR-1116 ss-1]